MSAHRKALLIGIPDAPRARAAFGPLDKAVKADLTALRKALEGSGYEVEILTGPEAGRSAIGTRIHETSRDAPPGSTLLLYFSGHGLRLHGTDYLVPADARAPEDGDWKLPYRDTLLPADIGPYLADCRAGTVLWLVDACRNSPPGTEAAAFGNSTLTGPPHSRFAVLVGCRPGQRCGHTDEGSFFTRGLAAALDPLSAARTVQEVYAAAAARTAREARQHALEQDVSIRYAPDREPETKDARICTGRKLLEKWREAVNGTPLWERVEPGGGPAAGRLRQALLSLADDTARRVHQAQGRLPAADPWADDAFPVRLLTRTLPLLLPPDACLSPVEAAALIAAPFLREAAWAERLGQAAECEPLAVERQPQPTARRAHLEQVHGNHPTLARKLAAARARGRTGEAQQVALWLVHRWIAECLDIDESPVPATAARTLARDLLGEDAEGSGRNEELAGLLAALALAVDAVPDTDPDGTRQHGSVRLAEGTQVFRERPLRALLRLAAVLAADARTLPDIVAEHLAVSVPVVPGDVLRLLGTSLHWERDGEGLHLHLLCPHEALHAALSDITERADRLSATLRAEAGSSLPGKQAALLAALPARVTARGLRPRQQDNAVAYEVPLLRFRLAHTEVRELLMGRQLYGDPALALREMYQNALDACRYRAMRCAYLRSRGQQMPWEGRITFTQGEDGRGRYVECRDNGVGMGLEQLKNTFTKAGSRFEQSRAFRREQARWLRHDPTLRLYPNSRFGIGVFSYFMLAREMTIVTREVTPGGVAARHAWRVDIPSSGSLFRIVRQPDDSGDALAEGGTRVRLYLRDDPELAGLSCARTLRDLVAVSEFRLTAGTGTGSPVRWSPGRLEHGPVEYPARSQEAVPGTLWWTEGKGALLCDGIATDRKPFGYVLNLTGPQAGRLSVDRNKLQDWDRGWADGILRQAADVLPGWPGLTMSWLWELQRDSLHTARTIWPALSGRGLRVPLSHGRRELDLDRVGWLAQDAALHDSTWHGTPRSVRVTHNDDSEDLPGELFGYPPYPEEALTSLTAWRRAAMELPAGRDPAPAALTGYPVPYPGEDELSLDIASDWRPAVAWAHTVGLTVEEVLRSARRMRIAHPALAPPRHTGTPLPRVPDRDEWTLTRALCGVRRNDPMWHSPVLREDLLGIAVASRELQLPLGKVVSRCGRYSALPPGTPLPEVPPHHRDYICTDEDIHLLFTADATKGSIPPWRVRLLSSQSHNDHQRVIESLRSFEWLGLRLRSPETCEEWQRLDEDLYDLLRVYCWGTTGQQYAVRWAATVSLAARRRLSLAAAEQQLVARCQELSLVYQPRAGAGGTETDLVPSLDTADLLDKIYRWNGKPEPGLDMFTLSLHRPPDTSPARLADMADELSRAGLEITPHLGVLRDWDALPSDVRTILDADFRGEPVFPRQLPTSAVLLAAGEALNEPLAAVWDLMRPASETHGFPLPELPRRLAGYRASRSEVRLLLSGVDLRSERVGWREVTPAALVRYARSRRVGVRQAYERLAPLRALGALLPDADETALAALPEEIPEPADVLALEGEHRVSGSDEPLVPLDVVSIAGRLGEPVCRTWRRLEPYVPLGPGARVPCAPDVLPCWQDLAILAVYLDGKLPAIAGRVSRTHVAHAARGVGESEEWVWERLGRYAGMFGLDLSEGPGGE
ncbi:HD domain-containing protein [Streptomyces aidingensis]|uniref:Caspase domain-containing protein n=1 Tax=Streptomyces aidingensis TaxID=910347 RepID=A0A1I1JGV1_9ACTN|nr:caspase family protein [Streptomyces aidingensis]SFC47747.1 Caspase domain-containing protein [Streptomyces aidingensis]